MLISIDTALLSAAGTLHCMSCIEAYLIFHAVFYTVAASDCDVVRAARTHARCLIDPLSAWTIPLRYDTLQSYSFSFAWYFFRFTNTSTTYTDYRKMCKWRHTKKALKPQPDRILCIAHHCTILSWTMKLSLKKMGKGKTFSFYFNSTDACL
jgi:hypothetical protein